MKITGRNIKRRLYGLSRLPSNIKRVRYFRGHGVHSPYVYSIVREVFMRSAFIGESRSLYDALIGCGIARRRAVQLQNLVEHCHYSTFAIDCEAEAIAGRDFVVATTAIQPSRLKEMATAARKARATLCIIAPSLDRTRDGVCQELIDEHCCTSVDNRGYLLLFNNHLPKQKFKL